MAARLLLGELSVCFVNVHLASGQQASAERNQHLSQVLTDAFQHTSSRGAPRPAKHGYERRSMYSATANHFAVIFGDFNSRLDLPKEAGWPSGPQKLWLSLDEILLGQFASLRGFREGVISFPPTYKYKTGTSALNTKRVPAWCDRIVYKAESGIVAEVLEYDSFPDLNHTSDHHPVGATFEVSMPQSSHRNAISWAQAALPKENRGYSQPTAVKLGPSANVKFEGTSYSSSQAQVPYART